MARHIRFEKLCRYSLKKNILLPVFPRSNKAIYY
jgi:hypothetical protein